LNGTISAWDTGPTAFMQVATPGALYPGLAINGPQTRLYAANGSGSGSIGVFDSAFAPLSLAADAFVDPSLPTGLVPFNVRDIGGDVYVVNAPAGRANDIIA
jgi:DNA-binding beta-propeller fold protein YncE